MIRWELDREELQLVSLLHKISLVGQFHFSEAPRSGHTDLGESESYSMSGKISAKWHAKASTRVSIKSNKKSIIKSCVVNSHTSIQI